MDAALAALVETVREAAAAHRPLRLRGGGSKDFYGNQPAGEHCDLTAVRGVLAYEPSELVLSARAGTPLPEIEALLARQGQMLAFEPPHFGATATLGGCVAAGLAGPRRTAHGPTYGSVRDSVLGARLLDGRGQLLSFGGTVIKNVAGYDVARALAGSLGILGIIVELSVKVLPVPDEEATLCFAVGEDQALQQLADWSGEPLPLSASLWCEDTLWLRLSGAAAAVRAASARLGGEVVPAAQAAALWSDLREQRMAFFAGDEPLWRFSLPPTAAPLALGSSQLIEWGGAQRWLRSAQPAGELRERARALGGHATLFRGGERHDVFTPLSPPLRAIHGRLKAQFDPAGIFNPGRLYAGL